MTELAGVMLLKWSKSFESGPPSKSAMSKAMKVVRYFRAKARTKSVHSIELVEHGSNWVDLHIEFYPTRAHTSSVIDSMTNRLVTGK